MQERCSRSWGVGFFCTLQIFLLSVLFILNPCLCAIRVFTVYSWSRGCTLRSAVRGTGCGIAMVTRTNLHTGRLDPPATSAIGMVAAATCNTSYATCWLMCGKVLSQAPHGAEDGSTLWTSVMAPVQRGASVGAALVGGKGREAWEGEGAVPTAEGEGGSIRYAFFSYTYCFLCYRRARWNAVLVVYFQHLYWVWFHFQFSYTITRSINIMSCVHTRLYALVKSSSCFFQVNGILHPIDTINQKWISSLFHLLAGGDKAELDGQDVHQPIQLY